jgi:hypothetical protein
MDADKLIKEIELLRDSFDSDYALELNGYSKGITDAIELVKKLKLVPTINVRQIIRQGFEEIYYECHSCEQLTIGKNDKYCCCCGVGVKWMREQLLKEANDNIPICKDCDFVVLPDKTAICKKCAFKTPF